MLSTYTTLNNKGVSPPSRNTTLGSREYSIMKPRSTPSSTPMSRSSNSLVFICKCERARASNAQIHWLDVSIELEASTLTSSTLLRVRLLWWRTSSMDGKKCHGCQHDNIFALRRSKFMGNLEPSYKKLDLQELLLETCFVCLFIYIFFHLVYHINRDLK